MPPASSYDPQNKVLKELADMEFKQRRAIINENLRYYEGDHDKPLKDDKDNVILNLCRMSVDRTIAFLLPQLPHFEVDKTPTKTEDEQWLEDQWEAAGGVPLMANMARNGALAGQVYARVARGRQHAKIMNLDPRNIITWWDADDYERVLWYELRWVDKVMPETALGVVRKSQERHYRQDVVALYSDDGEVTDWQIIDYELVGEGYVRRNEDLWGSPLGPIVDWQHLPKSNSAYGEHELQHRHLNDAVNKVASDIKRILRFHASPRTIVLGASVSEIQHTGIDSVWSINKPRGEVEVKNLEMQSDLGSSMAMLEMLKEMFFTASSVVIRPGGLDAFRGMTNLGVRAAFMDMIAKNERLRRQYDSGIVAICKRLQMLAGRDIMEPHLEWPDALPIDERETLGLIQQQMAMGIMSKQTAAAKLGLNWEAEKSAIQEEALDDGFLLEGAPMPAGQFAGGMVSIDGR
jgi:hypothetical protein